MIIEQQQIPKQLKQMISIIGTGRTQTNKNITMGTIKYTSAGASAGASLVADAWNIADGGLI